MSRTSSAFDSQFVTRGSNGRGVSPRVECARCRSSGVSEMRVQCLYSFPGKPERDVAGTLWSFIEWAEKLICVLDGDAVLVAAANGIREVHVAEVGVGLWRKRGVLGEVLAGYASRSPEQYRTRLKTFAAKPVEWLD